MFNRTCTGTLTEDGDAVRVASKLADVLLNSLEGHMLVG